MKHEYKIEIERDGRWWMVHIPELDGLTQARRLSEAELMGREWIAVTTGTPLDDVTVSIANITVPGIGEIAGPAHAIVDHRTRATHDLEAAQREATRYAATLMHAGVTVRDAGTLLDLSPQRVSQLAAK